MMRCLSLASVLTDAGWDCGFAVNEKSVNIIPGLRRHDILNVDTLDDVPKGMMERWPKPWDLAVVDHYGLDASFESKLRPQARRILVIDDLADRPHDCDFLLDQTLGRKPENYLDNVPSGCRFFFGPLNALLRSEFAEARIGRIQRKSNNRLSRIVVCFGASDPSNLTLDALEAVAASGLDISVDALVGSSLTHIDALQRQSEKMNQTVNLYIDPHNVAEILASADLAIGAAGITAWERCCVGLPTLMVVRADNQKEIAKALEKKGAAIILGRAEGQERMNIGTASRGLREFAEKPFRLDEMGKAAFPICDGLGTLRLLMSILPPELTLERKGVTLRFAEANDSDTILRWQEDERTRRYFRNPGAPNDKEHNDWLSDVLNDPKRYLTIIQWDEEPVGVLRLDRVDRIERETMEISIFVAPKLHGRGIGTAALKVCHKLWPRNKILAEVLPGNAASHALFKRAGYKVKSETVYVREPLAMAHL